MAKQWHNPKIPQRPYLRYNPSIVQRLPKVYRPWFFLVALLLILLGVAIIVLTSIMKGYDDELMDQLFHLWVGIPLVFIGLVAFVVGISKNKKSVVIFLVLVIIVSAICASGAIIAGLRYWMDGWNQTKIDLGDDRCKVGSSKICQCSSVPDMPSAVDDCDDLEHMCNLFISVIALDAGAFLVCVASVYLSFMAICCGPWMYMEWYDEQYDPDLKPPHDNVRPIGANPNRAYVPDPAYSR